MINLKFAKHRSFFEKHYPGIDQDKLTALTRELFDFYLGECEKLGFAKPTQWTDPSMSAYLKWRLLHTTLGLEVDRGGELGLVTERTLLRWVASQVRGMNLKLPFGINDYNCLKNQSARGEKLWDMTKVLTSL